MIRDYIESDRLEILPWWEQSNARQYIDRPDKQWSEYVVNNPEVVCRVCEENRRIVGLLQCDQFSRTAEFSVISHPDCRRKGVATGLINDLLLSLESKYHYLGAAVEPSNSASRHLLLKLGFEVSSKDEFGLILYQKCL